MSKPNDAKWDTKCMFQNKTRNITRHLLVVYLFFSFNFTASRVEKCICFVAFFPTAYIATNATLSLIKVIRFDPLNPVKTTALLLPVE